MLIVLVLGSARQRDAKLGARNTAQAAAEDFRFLDRDELAFREHVLTSVGKGRLAGQDASLSSQAGQRRPSVPRSSSFSSRVSTRRVSSAHPSEDTDRRNSQLFKTKSNSVDPENLELQSPADITAKPTIKKRFSFSMLLSAKDGSTFSPAISRKGSKTSSTNSRPTSMHSDCEPIQELNGVEGQILIQLA